MKLCIDWEAIHQDWQASGLSKNRMQEGLKAGLDKNELLDARINGVRRHSIVPTKRH